MLPIKVQIDKDDIRTSMKILNIHQTTGEYQTRFWHLSTADSFSVDTYNENDKTLHEKSLTTID